jgi:hypothetical protein
MSLLGWFRAAAVVSPDLWVDIHNACSIDVGKVILSFESK